MQRSTVSNRARSSRVSNGLWVCAIAAAGTAALVSGAAMHPGAAADWATAPLMAVMYGLLGRALRRTDRPQGQPTNRPATTSIG